MAVSVTGNPSSALPGQVVGKPIRLPHFMLCTQGERFCGWVRTANTRIELADLMIERRKHEDGCKGGLIVP
jgi:hypothetical protein